MKRNTKTTLKCIIYFVLIVVCAMTTIYSFMYFLNNKQNIKIAYKESGKIDYQVNYKSNNFYSNNSIQNGNTYVSSLINNIVVNFDYNTTYSSKVSGNYKYEIVASLIANKVDDTSSNYWTKDYVLATGNDDINDIGIFNINKDVNIDYQYYVKILNEFKQTAGISVDGILKVQLNIESTSNKDNYKTPIDIKQSMSLVIPLTEASMNIELTKNVANTNNEILLKTVSSMTTKHYISISISILSLILFTVFVIKFIESILNINEGKSEYEIKLEKILTTYNSIIVNVDNVKDLSDYNIITVNSFDELLDAHGEVRMPINFAESKEKQESIFILLNGDVAWVYRLK